MSLADQIRALEPPGYRAEEHGLWGSGFMSGRDRAAELAAEQDAQLAALRQQCLGAQMIAADRGWALHEIARSPEGYAGKLARDVLLGRSEDLDTALAQAQRRVVELEAENERLAKDAARLDWLADPANDIGNVQLPTWAVMANLHSLRDAIDAAMKAKP